MLVPQNLCPMVSTSMAKSAQGAPWRSLAAAAAAAAERRLCTATEPDRKPLYRRLSALGNSPASRASETMDGWLREGHAITVHEMMKHVRELRRYKRYGHALELISWMEKRGMHISGVTHAVRLNLMCKVKGIDLAEDYFFSLPQLAKNQLTYGALLSGYCQLNMEDKAITLYELMKQLNLASRTLVHNNLLSLNLKLGQPEKVLSLFQEMKQMNLLPDNFTYSAVISAYASLNDIDSIERLLREAEERYEVVLDWTVYSKLAAIYTSAGLFSRTESTLKKLEHVMGNRDRMPFHHLISLYAGIGNLEKVNSVWKLLKTSFGKVTNTSYLVMLHALSKLDDMDALKQCFQEWDSARMNYDIRLVNVVIKSYLRKDMVEEAELLWDKAKQNGAGSDSRTFNYFIDYYLSHNISLALKCLESAASLFKHNDLKLSKENSDRFLKYFEEAKAVDGAEVISNCLNKLNCIDAQAYKHLLLVYLASDKKEPSLRQRIMDDGIQINLEIDELLERVCD